MLSGIKHCTASLFIAGLVTACSGQVPSGKGTKPVDHGPWDALLKEHVDSHGMVSYKGFIEDNAILQRYLDALSASPPDPALWPEAEQLAYWINAYNAFTVKLIIDHYPVKSIGDLHPLLKIPGLNTVWHAKFFKIGGQEYSLDAIEHTVLRKKFNEPRIHFAINCASFSCPPMLNEAFTAEKIEEQLTRQARAFINDEARNRIGKDKVQLSMIFNWFTADFTKDGSLIDYLNRYSATPIKRKAGVSYLEYDWRLNDRP